MADIGVVIVNFNSAPLALDAALSVLHQDPKARVIIVDNASTDHSLKYFNAVFCGDKRHTTERPQVNSHQVHFSELSTVTTAIESATEAVISDAQITVLAAAHNRGFAAGCNIGLRYLQDQGQSEIYLLLNPDAVLGEGALNAFSTRLQDKAIGLCGASLMRFEAPESAQAFGGASLNQWTCLGRNIGAGQGLEARPDTSEVEAAISYPLGAAIAFRRDCLEKIGLLSEGYFLYYEEADWAALSRRHFDIGWAEDAVIYHRHGAAAGSRLAAGGRSPLADYHMARSRMIYSRKWNPWAIPVLYGLALVQAFRRLIRGQGHQARAVLAGSVSGLFPKHL